MVEWDWYCDANTFRVFMHLVICANHVTETWRGIEVERGQIVTGRDALSKALGLSPQEIRTSLDKLKLSKDIISRATNKFTVITICDYEKFNGSACDDQPAKVATNNPTNNPTSNPTNKSYANSDDCMQVEANEQPANQPALQPQTRSREKENKKTPSFSAKNDDERGFELFWANYPKKSGKKDALKAWKKMRCGNGIFETIMAKLAQFKKSDSWTRDDGRFVPNPATWINGERWTDELECKVESQGQKIGGLTF